ncbi:MAG: alpha/beta hydrolase ['Candidatus Kapabacteria' thiocyanatum]|uniref:AB hydrolase-1 domain-containing protein n=1 Tax=Candidatus Kapaibacterium thiocyanatum TaxID=1895771 RepID=A0A1M3L2F1_9BACT|nr:alpha/beta hydrolase ['Candidatus Kapabacteria' thiocyanatum]OJX59296.1 MAG: hypothetical protein BGO89_02440 ['Candidatus Kapabacteria' thiocyanatum]
MTNRTRGIERDHDSSDGIPRVEYLVMLMLTIILWCSMPALSSAGNVDTLYHKSYGDPADPAVIFVHGGPGYNSVGFELGAAKELARTGYFVIVFDQRGCGRSRGYRPRGGWTFDDLHEDIDTVAARYGLKTFHLLGHSWGGTLAAFYALAHPDRCRSLCIASSPLSYQRTFRALLDRADTTERFREQVRQIRTLDTAGLIYASRCFALAMQTGAYTPRVKSSEADTIMTAVRQDSAAKLMRDMTPGPTIGIYMAERYTMLNMGETWRRLIALMPVGFIAGMDDGLFDPVHIEAIRDVLGKDRTIIIEGASHNVFIDKRAAFIESYRRLSSNGQ